MTSKGTFNLMAKWLSCPSLFSSSLLKMHIVCLPFFSSLQQLTSLHLMNDLRVYFTEKSQRCVKPLRLEGAWCFQGSEKVLRLECVEQRVIGAWWTTLQQGARGRSCRGFHSCIIQHTCLLIIYNRSCTVLMLGT